MLFFFKQKTAYEMRISDWSSDVCSSDLLGPAQAEGIAHHVVELLDGRDVVLDQPQRLAPHGFEQPVADESLDLLGDGERLHAERAVDVMRPVDEPGRRRLEERNRVV